MVSGPLAEPVCVKDKEKENRGRGGGLPAPADSPAAIPGGYDDGEGRGRDQRGSGCQGATRWCAHGRRGGVGRRQHRRPRRPSGGW